MDIYKFGNCYTYTPDIEIEKKNGKYGIIYLPTNEIILPFEYDNIMINDEAINNFFVVKSGLVGAVHLEGNRQTNNKILAYEMFAEREKLTAYVSKPVLICDLPCEYDYFTVLLCGESIFYNNKENVYLYVGNKNTIIHFEEVFLDNYSVWGKKNNILYLVSVGEIQYSEPFTKFRFTAIQRGSFCSYVDYENYDKLMWIDRIKKYKLIKQNQHLVNNPPKVLCFNDKKLNLNTILKNVIYALTAGLQE